MDANEKVRVQLFYLCSGLPHVHSITKPEGRILWLQVSIIALCFVFGHTSWCYYFGVARLGDPLPKLPWNYTTDWLADVAAREPFCLRHPHSTSIFFSAPHPSENLIQIRIQMYGTLSRPVSRIRLLSCYLANR